MKVVVKDIMVRDARFCRPDTNLAEIAGIMWDQGCGALPVVENGALTGMITDRDICIALGTRNLRASDVRAREVGGARYFARSPDENISTALKTMEAQGVHRLPVVDRDGKLAGVLGERREAFRGRGSHRATQRGKHGPATRIPAHG